MRSNTINIGLFVGLAVLPLAFACSKGDRGSQQPLSAAAGEAYTSEEVTSMARDLTAELEMPEEPRAKVLEKLRRVLEEPDYRQDVHDRMTQRGVTGVFAFRLGEEGAVSTQKQGKALIRLKGQTESREFAIAGDELGAELAPSREWGLGLVLGLREGESIDGTYEGAVRAGAPGAGAGTVTLEPGRGNHELVLIGAGAGVSLDVAGASLELDDPA